LKNWKLIPFTTPDELSRAVADAWLGEIAAANRKGKAHCVALSGGRITLKFFASVLELVRAQRISLAHVHFFWADERCVLPTDAESNFAAANEHFFKPLGIGAEQIHRIQGETPSKEAAELATKEILRIVAANAAGQPVLDLIFLGMGEDGHVASLFPGESEAVRVNPAVFRAIDNSPKPPPNRVTMGYAAIVAAKEVWVLASGAGKQAALNESLSTSGRTPLAGVLQRRGNTKVFTDIAL